MRNSRKNSRKVKPLKSIESDFFFPALDDLRETLTLSHYKTIILEKILEDSDPNDSHIKEWTSSHIQVNRLLKEMQKEGLITIELVEDGKTIRRVLKAVLK